MSVADKRGRTAGQVALRVRVSIPADVRQLLGIAEGEVAVIGDSKTVLFMDPSFFRHHTCKPISRQSVGLPPENVTRIKVSKGDSHMERALDRCDFMLMYPHVHMVLGVCGRCYWMRKPGFSVAASSLQCTGRIRLHLLSLRMYFVCTNTVMCRG